MTLETQTRPFWVDRFHDVLERRKPSKMRHRPFTRQVKFTWRICIVHFQTAAEFTRQKKKLKINVLVVQLRVLLLAFDCNYDPAFRTQHALLEPPIYKVMVLLSY